MTAKLEKSTVLGLRPRMQPQGATLILLCLLPMVNGCSHTSRTSLNLRSGDAPTTIETPEKSVVQPLPPCPLAGAKRANMVSGRHKVILSWIPSVPSTWLRRGVIGYCVYRNRTTFAPRTSKASKALPNKSFMCSDCELINSTPFDGVACVDDLVEDGASYYYVVTAINAHGKIISPSNEIPATVPTTKEPTSSATAGSYPLCRGSAEFNQIGLLLNK